MEEEDVGGGKGLSRGGRAGVLEGEVARYIYTVTDVGIARGERITPIISREGCITFLFGRVRCISLLKGGEILIRQVEIVAIVVIVFIIAREELEGFVARAGGIKCVWIECGRDV